MEKIGSLAFCRSSLIGEGRYGSIFHGTYETMKHVAVKRVSNRKTKVDSHVFLNVEGHPNIIRYFCTDSSDVEFM